MTPRKWFMNSKAIAWAKEELFPDRFIISKRESEIEDTPVYVFTEEELYRYVGDIVSDIEDCIASVKPKYNNFKDYWQQKFGGGE